MELSEQRGLGFQTIRELPGKHGLPLPIVAYEDPYMVFRFPRAYEGLRDVENKPGLKNLND